MLCEGTRIDLSDQTGEQDVFERVAEQIRRTKALVLADYPFRDIERVTTFYRAAKECGRRLAIDLRQAYLLGALQGSDAGAPAPTDPHIAIYVRRKNWGLITKDGYPPTIVDADYDVWERPFLLLDNAVTCDDIRRDQDQYVLHLDFFELTDLVDIRPAPGSCFVRSVTEPHDEEDEIDLERVRNWLALYGLMPYLQVHASGHASGPELTELVRDISPRVLVPIHTEQPQRFADELAGTGIEVRLPVCAEPIVF
jgi:ribonuclease J